jgi:folate-dependent phosphoribosylglycinamide formyltransferase PurN
MTKQDLIHYIEEEINKGYILYRKAVIENENSENLEKIKRKIKEFSLKKIFLEKINLNETEIKQLYNEIKTENFFND